MPAELMLAIGLGSLCVGLMVGQKVGFREGLHHAVRMFTGNHE